MNTQTKPKAQTPVQQLACVLLAERHKIMPKDVQLRFGHAESHMAQTDATRLLAFGHCAKTWGIKQCNGIMRYDATLHTTRATWTEQDDARMDNALQIVGGQTLAIVKRYGIDKVGTGGDPRGYMLRMFLPSGRYNTMGGADSGWGIG